MRCEFCERLAWYRCGHTGVPVCPVHARLEVVASQPGRRLAAVEVHAGLPRSRVTHPERCPEPVEE